MSKYNPTNIDCHTREMSDISIDVHKSVELYNIYRKNHQEENLPDLIDLRLGSASDFLDALSLFALRPNTTLAVCFSFNGIILEIISRWICKFEEFELKFLEDTDKRIHIPGLYILLALSRIVSVVKESSDLIEIFLVERNFWGNPVLIDKCIEHAENNNMIESFLLANYRLLYHDDRFKKFINPRKLYSILNLSMPLSRISRYLITKIMSRYMGTSEESEGEMIEKHVGFNNILDGFYEEKSIIIDYRFLHIFEARRVSKYLELRMCAFKCENSLKEIVSLNNKDLSRLVVNISGILVPNMGSFSSNTSSKDNLDIVSTKSTKKTTIQVAEHIRKSEPVLLYGKPGAGKTYLITQIARSMSQYESLVKIHLGEQTDAKLLLGTYVSGKEPGSFEWTPGVLTLAVKEGRWVLIEDIDSAPTEVLSVLLSLLEKRELSIPSRGEVIKARNGFQLFATAKPGNSFDEFSIPNLIGLRSWSIVHVEEPSDNDIEKIIVAKFKNLGKLIPLFIECYKAVLEIYSLPKFVAMNRANHPRIISNRDLFKFCGRCNMLIEDGHAENDQLLLKISLYENIFFEAVDCFCSSIVERSAFTFVVKVIGDSLEIPSSRVELFLKKHIPKFVEDETTIRIGRATLEKSREVGRLSLKVKNRSNFARTNHSLRLLEQIAICVHMVEPLLLVGETGTGKTTIVQELAKYMNKRLIVINVSQQTESADLLGGFKPVNTKTLAVPIQEAFETLFITTFSKKRNEKFTQVLSKCFNRNQWKNIIKLWREAIRMAREILMHSHDNGDIEEGGPKKKRKLGAVDRKVLLEKWSDFDLRICEFETHARNVENSLVFSFIEGSVVNAVRKGDWLLLDEINLASADTLDSISDLLSDKLDERSILLTERGDVEAIKAHPDFRIFGCMNPSTDIGKRDLPSGIRTKFSEIYVRSPDEDIQDLLFIIESYIKRFAIGDELVAGHIAELYIEAKKLADANSIVDGANQKPHFSIRTLTRTLTYVRDIVSTYGLRRSLYEGFCMTFLTLLDDKSEKLLKPIIEKYTIGKLKNYKSVISQCPPPPSHSEEYVQFKHYWIKKGLQAIKDQPHYIMTPFVEKNMLNLVRAAASRRFPVLIQGPTSAGKTSMIKYLADITGHKFVRINNHEHTDLQEYLGSFVSDSSGKLAFKEGILVQAVREGHWIVLDELNLAPTDVLEALNRLLDDNRELFIPETQELISPHPEFMLFATQNPPGVYGGRKMLSRAFRNRFLELHFDDIPQDELEIILRERCQIAPSYAKKIVEVYRQLTLQRQSTRLFEQKNSYATLRDLFRWALRDAVGYEELAANGYMLLAEKVRNSQEKIAVKSAIERVMKVTLNMEQYYRKLENDALMKSDKSIVWTKSMKRLAVLVSVSMKNNEPLLLVGETGCGKTTICQLYASYLNRPLITVNAHQNTETSDLLGAQRPMRNRLEHQEILCKKLLSFFKKNQIEISKDQRNLDDLIGIFNSMTSLGESDQNEIEEIKSGIKNNSILFEWHDGPLTQAMKQGSVFLLDEISLADDSVLERLNSVLEPEKTLLLAEKGTDDSFVSAKDGFQFLATMNPGGDYGKKELSPALRNRFTEIWVPSMDDFEDVTQVVRFKLNPEIRFLTALIVNFSEFYAKEFGHGRTDTGIISLRDILAWVQFINTCWRQISPLGALLHGCLMVFIDSLGTNNTSFLSGDDSFLASKKEDCIERLSKFANEDLRKLNVKQCNVTISNSELKCGIFSVERASLSFYEKSFNLNAPTSALNAMKVVRAMQVDKPILLEGSPGVGKTSLISALANAIGQKLIRINLSEQTDLVDLFGSDSPVEDGSAGEFVWRDAPFLRAMKRGEWVLLDEMNLASQSVLEGLNACLDHRGEAYIPELDKSFPKHPDFVIFAAQNPQSQGGGRKGLPKSFINRFTVVYVDALKEEDLKLISNHLFPRIGEEILEKLIRFISRLEEEVVHKKLWGTSGGPWEFNLRDTLRWLSLLDSNIFSHKKEPYDFFTMIVRQRFRTAEDRGRASELYFSVFGKQPQREVIYNLGEMHLQVGSALIKRNSCMSKPKGENLLPLQCNFEFLETAIHCINQNIPLIMVGPSCSGKTDLVRFLGDVVGMKIVEFSMNSETDSMDILGGYEQVDLTRLLKELISDVFEVFSKLCVLELKAENANYESMQKGLEVIRLINLNQVSIGNYNVLHSLLEWFTCRLTNQDVTKLYNRSLGVVKKINEIQKIKFQWFDGLLVKAVERGYWLILDNANLCNPSVLDRLNSLLETNGMLTINECSNEDGSPRVVTPHPNFRLFMTMNPRYGELSRAMRNRGIEVYMDSLHSRYTGFDKMLMERECTSIDTEGMTKNHSDVNGPAIPYAALIPSDNSILRSFSLQMDVFSSFRHDCDFTYIIPVLVSLLSFSDLALVSAFSDSLFSSKFDDHTIETFRRVLNTVRYLNQEKGIEKLQSMYNEPKKNLIAVVSKDQSLHPLFNYRLAGLLCDKFPFIGTFESSSLFSLAYGILDGKSKLQKLEDKALHGNVHKLSYLEASIAHNLGRSVRNCPRINVHSFVVKIYSFLELIFKEVLMKNQFFLSDSYLGNLLELQLISTLIINGLNERNEAKFRAFFELVLVWIDNNNEIYARERCYEELRSFMCAFKESISLNTGSSMDRIWNAFRGIYPSSESTWSSASSILALSDKFDEVVREKLEGLNEDVINTKSNFVQLYRDILNDNITEEETSKFFSVINQAIEDLKNISEKQFSKRINNFEEEFSLISNILEFVQPSDWEAEVLKLSIWSGRKTLHFFATSNGKWEPYPSSLECLWEKKQGNEEKSLSDGLVTDRIARSILQKVWSLGSQPGKFKEQNNSDVETLRKCLIAHSKLVSVTHFLTLVNLLFTWILKIFKVHITLFDEHGRTTINTFESLSFSLINMEHIISLLDLVKDEKFRSILESYMIPALRFLKNEGMVYLGKAWILFCSGMIELYVPDSPNDPAIKEHILYLVYRTQKDFLVKLKLNWKKAATIHNGEDSTHIVESIPDAESLEAPDKPAVFRIDTSMDTLFEEWKQFTESTIGSVEGLVKATDEGEFKIEVCQRIQIFQTNTSRFLERLSKDYMTFADLNDILKGYILGMKLGFECLSLEYRNINAENIYDPLFTVDVTSILSKTSYEDAYIHAKEFAREVGTENLVPEYLMMFFFLVGQLHYKVEPSENLNLITSQCLQAIYYRWCARNLRLTEEENQMSSLYKYKNSSDDLESNFKEMFPDFEDVILVDFQSEKKSESMDEFYFAFADNYVKSFISNQFDLEALINMGHEVFVLLSPYLESFKFKSNSSSKVGALVNRLSLHLEDLKNEEMAFNFYQNNRSSESSHAFQLIARLLLRVKELLEMWPENATLQSITHACDEYLSLPGNSAMARLLQKIEQIYTYIAEWEKFAHSNVSLKQYFEDLTKTIISWRKLELATWRSLLEFEDVSVQKSAGKWWFHLFETIVVPLMAHPTVDESYVSSLLPVIKSFLNNGIYGDFLSRVNLLRAFNMHIKLLYGDTISSNALQNFIIYFEQFIPIVDAKILETKKQLEKDITEVILLASWKDVNIDALKQSAKKSHNSLFKIVRKYRALLMTSVMPLIEEGFGINMKVSAFEQHDMLPNEPLVDIESLTKSCQEISSWKERPTRLQKTAIICRNTDKYFRDFKSFSIPKLHDYARDVLEQAQTLRDNTPKTFNEQNKKAISALKSQKRKLLSDVVREIKRIGIKTTTNVKTTKVQNSLESIFVNSKCFDVAPLNNLNSYFLGIIDILPRLRKAALSPHEDLPRIDIERSMAANENLVSFLILLREPIFKLSRSLMMEKGLYTSFVNAFDTLDATRCIVPGTQNESLKFNLSKISIIVYWLPKLIDFAIDIVLLNCKDLRDSINTLETQRKLLMEFSERIPNLNENILGDEHKNLVSEFSKIYSNMKIVLIAWSEKHSEFNFAVGLVLDWIEGINFRPLVSTSTSLNDIKTVDDIERCCRALTTTILFAIQNIQKDSEQASAEDEDNWVLNLQQVISRLISLSLHAQVLRRMQDCHKVISRVDHNKETSILTYSIIGLTLPIVFNYIRFISEILEKASVFYLDISHSTLKFSRILYSLCTEGFCSPEPLKEEKNDDNLHDGTGLGDGEGAANNSNDVEEDEDLTEDAQNPKQDEENKEEQEDDDEAINIEGDMGGELEDLSDQNEQGSDEDEQADLDEEVDDIDDLDANALDEKMWDEEVNDEMKEKDAKKAPENSHNEENIEANENENGNENHSEKDHSDLNEEDQNEGDADTTADEEDPDENNDVGEQDDEVRNEESEMADEDIQEAEALQLPEDMNLDSEGDNEDKTDSELEKDVDMDIDDEVDVQAEEENEHDVNDDLRKEDLDEQEEREQEEGANEQDEDSDAQDENQGGENNDDLNNEEAMDSNEVEQELQENAEQDTTEEKSHKDEAPMGVDAFDNGPAEDENIEGASNQTSGKKTDGADNNDHEDSSNIGASGNTQESDRKEEYSEDSSKAEESHNMARESLKQLGDSLKEFHRRRQEIKEASTEDDKNDEMENHNAKADEFQHVRGENTDYDTQALGAAEKDQIQPIDENNAIDDDTAEDIEMKSEAVDDELMEGDSLDQEFNEIQNDNLMMDKKEFMFDALKTNTLLSEGDQKEEIDEALMKDESEDYESDHTSPVDSMFIQKEDIAPRSISQAIELWRRSDSATQELSSSLCEQLRLILEPTVATKLRGDYKTGKRLNMKRIIPYIASDFRKDKIWLRRTKPSKRQYQVMIAVDDSKSMSESRCTELAFNSIALVAKALNQLESGGLSVVRFGEDVKVLHEFNTPFNSYESGPKIFQWFDFQQDKTDITKLCNNSLKIFEKARVNTNEDLWQLQIIISDGVCEDHETIQRLVRNARENRIMMVFVIIDGVNSNESIMDMSQVSYALDESTNQMNLQVKKYLDSFPFEFYVVVRNINELPEMLALILRQFFSTAASI